MIPACRHCGEFIVWGKCRGRWVLLNPEPDPTGRFIRTGSTYRHLVGVKLEQVQVWGWKLYSRHRCQAQLNPARRVGGESDVR